VVGSVLTASALDVSGLRMGCWTASALQLQMLRWATCSLILAVAAGECRRLTEMLDKWHHWLPLLLQVAVEGYDCAAVPGRLSLRLEPAVVCWQSLEHWAVTIFSGSLLAIGWTAWAAQVLLFARFGSRLCRYILSAMGYLSEQL